MPLHFGPTAVAISVKPNTMRQAKIILTGKSQAGLEEGFNTASFSAVIRKPKNVITNKTIVEINKLGENDFQMKADTINAAIPKKAHKYHFHFFAAK